ncbi:hypothetical protein PR003_g8395 [Phytophthora rubi]|uniref:Uncharacterized protein n=1 Tax=Phytophthora rubi TaxID=129364 RepID=A0A6A4FJN2_9STRA|nr:hypothetical protein PR001_g7819 [Phytophthora rubi]KAE9344567.1 hypothetical protein PR003_g8395 [Phytophthora rubi]
MGATAQLREVILPGTLSTIGAVLIAICTASSHIALAIAMAVIWRFPIPFGYVFLVGPFLMIFWSFSVLVIGLHLLVKSKVLRQQIRTQFMIVSAHGLVTISYPVFTAVFHRLPGPQQLAFVFVMPLIKHFTKQIIATAAADLHEYVAPVVVFSVGLFHVFYTSICMQTAKSTITTLIMMTSDSFHVIFALRAIFHQANALKARQISELSSALRVERPLHCLEDLPGIIHDVFEDREISERACPIRVFAPSSLPLSDESVSFINGLTKSTRDAHVYALSRLHAWGPQSISHVDGADQQNETSDIVVFQQTVKGKQFAKDIDALKLREEVLPNAMLWSSFTRADQLFPGRSPSRDGF